MIFFMGMRLKTVIGGHRIQSRTASFFIFWYNRKVHRGQRKRRNHEESGSLTEIIIRY